MSAALSRLIGIDERAVGRAVAKLESLSGYASEDVRLVAEVEAKTAAKISSLGLDGFDTTAEELFHALQAKLQSDSAHLARAFGHSNDPFANAARLAQLMNHIDRPAVLAVKTAVLKDILRHNPPRRLAKQLHYRSLESMLKHQPVAQLWAGAQRLEANSWHQQAARAVAALELGDFEQRRVSFAAMPALAQPAGTPLIEPVTLSGLVAIWPNEQLTSSYSLTALALLAEAAETLAAASFYLKINQFSGHFGRRAAKLTLASTHTPVLELFDWHNLKDVLDGGSDTLRNLAKLHPALGWWADGRHLIHHAESSVSLNLADTAAAALAGGSFSRRSRTHGAKALRSRLLAGYARHDGVKTYLANLFDNTLVEVGPEPAFEAVLAS